MSEPEAPIPDDLKDGYNAAKFIVSQPECDEPWVALYVRNVERIARLEYEVSSLRQQRAQLTLLASNPDWTLAPDGMTAEQHAAAEGAYFGSDGKIHQIGEREPDGECWLWVVPKEGKRG